MTELTKEDARYHASLIGNWENNAQVNVLRNRYFHEKVAGFINSRSESGSNILELAGGAGYDLRLFLSLGPDFSNYVFSEVSEKMAEYAIRDTEDRRVGAYCIDAHDIPFADNQFDFVYTMSAFHHFRDMDKALRELMRITRDNGYIIFGIEPNRFWFNLIDKTKVHVRRLLPKKSHSPADDDADGFFLSDFNNIAERYGLRPVEIEPVWFLCGFIHYASDFLHKFLRLKTRIQLPTFIEKTIIKFDESLARLKIMKRFSWHYTVIYQKI